MEFQALKPEAAVFLEIFRPVRMICRYVDVYSALFKIQIKNRE